MILQMPPLRVGKPTCNHFYEDNYGGTILECIHCGKEVTIKMWNRSLNA